MHSKYRYDLRAVHQFALQLCSPPANHLINFTFNTKLYGMK